MQVIKGLTYVLVTPAYNEEVNIEKTIRSVVTQTVLPLNWIIVSNGSTDNTDHIVQGYCRDYGWIRFIRMPEHKDRHFAAKVQAFNAGYEEIHGVEFNIIGNLDADITFGPDYFEYLIDKFNENPLLGVAGTPYVEDGSHYDYRFTNIEHVSGACQLFRRGCFEDIGGYVPIKGGGIDWTAVTTARMKGWGTRTFTERVCYHHRKMGTGNTNTVEAFFRHGQKDYFLGGHPLWQCFRTFYQMKSKPYIIGGLLLFFGYVWAWITKTEIPISNKLARFNRKEQMERLKKFLFKFERAKTSK